MTGAFKTVEPSERVSDRQAEIRRKEALASYRKEVERLQRAVKLERERLSELHKIHKIARQQALDELDELVTTAEARAEKAAGRQAAMEAATQEARSQEKKLRVGIQAEEVGLSTLRAQLDLKRIELDKRKLSLDSREKILEGKEAHSEHVMVELGEKQQNVINGQKGNIEMEKLLRSRKKSMDEDALALLKMKSDNQVESSRLAVLNTELGKKRQKLLEAEKVVASNLSRSAELDKENGSIDKRQQALKLWAGTVKDDETQLKIMEQSLKRFEAQLKKREQILKSAELSAVS